MARKYLIPFLSILITVVLAFALQAHAPSWPDFFGWLALLCFIVGALQVLVGLLIYLTPKKILAKEVLYTGLGLLLIGVVVYVVMSKLV